MAMRTAVLVQAASQRQSAIELVVQAAARGGHHSSSAMEFAALARQEEHGWIPAKVEKPALA